MLNIIALAPFFLAAALADIVPKPPGTACPYGFDSFGLYCVVRDLPRALPSTDGNCPSGLDRSGSYCVRRGRAPDTVPKSGGPCPYGFDGSGAFCIRP